MSSPTYVPGSVPSGQAAPFLVTSSTDHGAEIALISSIGIALLLICFVIRIYIRINFSGPWLADDTLFALATAVALAQSSIACSTVHYGWGKVVKDISSRNLVKAEKLMYVVDLLYIVTLALSKHSLDLLFIRLTPYKRHIFCAKCIRYFVVIWAIGSIGAIGVRCHPSHPWKDITSDLCPTMLVRWKIVSAFNIVSEAAIFGLSIYLVVGLRMPLSHKTMVVVAFGLRLPTIAFCVIRIRSFPQAFYSTDPSFDGVPFSAWTQVELAYSVIAATLPCLKPFMSTIGSNWGEQPKTELSDSLTSGSYGLRNLFGKSHKSGPSSSNTTELASGVIEEHGCQEAVDVRLPYGPVHGNTMNHELLRGDSISHTSSVVHSLPLEDGVSTRSNDSQQMIIRKDTKCSIERT